MSPGLGRVAECAGGNDGRPRPAGYGDAADHQGADAGWTAAVPGARQALLLSARPPPRRGRPGDRRAHGRRAVLMRIPDLARIDREELGDTIAEAWLTRAQKRVARAWLDQ